MYAECSEGNRGFSQEITDALSFGCFAKGSKRDNGEIEIGSPRISEETHRLPDSHFDDDCFLYKLWRG